MIEPDVPAASRSSQRIAQVAADLRAQLTPLLHTLAGTPPRPVRLMRGPGLDKSLASRLVQASRTGTDAEFLHTVPSPTGLRILLDRARGLAGEAQLSGTAAAVDRFEALLDALPGGRQALDAQIGAGAHGVREKREQMARQASFKAQSFLFGHYCETLTTSLFLSPSEDGEQVDMLEVHRRIGLQRLVPGTPLPLLSVQADPPGAAADADADARPRLLSPDGLRPVRSAEDFVIHSASSAALPTLQVHHDGALATFVIGPDDTVALPARLTTAFSMRRVEPIRPAQAWTVVRNYMLHTPCQTLVRELFLAHGLWPDAQPLLGFYLPGPSGTPAITIEPGQPHLRRVNLSARIEQLPAGAAALDLRGVPDHRHAIELVLAVAGRRAVDFRGWRCEMAYPLPLIEMQLALRFGAPVAA